MLENNVRARLAPGTSAGTAGVANLLGKIFEPAADFPVFLQGGQWQATYDRLFGDVRGGPVIPPDGQQPYLAVPWTNEEPWYFTGGPHGGYGDLMTGWAALDFAPPIPSGCWRSQYAVHAVAPGLVMASDQGETWVDMDGDGDMRTGWVIFYMHLDSVGRVTAGTRVETGDVMGYPSCEGGVSTGSHLHLARLYNGQWMPANGPVPFQIGDWQASALVGATYDGYLTNTKTGQMMEACNCRSAAQNKFPYDVTKALSRPTGP
jgi:murein DD-endopeptidase MepM/ murein hydrolase activator NlpD